jgi:biotin/methionine sulfoxide reductase
MPDAATSLTHWGAFSAHLNDGEIAAVTPYPGDSDPSPLLGPVRAHQPPVIR